MLLISLVQNTINSYLALISARINNVEIIMTCLSFDRLYRDNADVKLHLDMKNEKKLQDLSTSGIDS